MVRATRATQLAVDDPIPSTPPAKKATVNKKRKRNSADDDSPTQDEHRLSLHPASDETEGQLSKTAVESEVEGDKDMDGSAMDETKDGPPSLKRQRTLQPEDDVKMDVESTEPLVSYPISKWKDAGESLLSAADAQTLLAILDAADPDALLDREITPPAVTRSSTSKASTTLRQILKDPSSYSSRSLELCIDIIRPAPPPPRTLPSQGDDDERNFCDLFTNLLRQLTSRHSGGVDVTRTSIEADPDSTIPLDNYRTTKFALHQHLPSGDFFTSAADISVEEASKIITGQASLVIVQPTIVIDPSLMPNLGSYSRPIKGPIIPNRLPQTRKVAIGATLDYGAFTSFAPSFDSEAGELSHREVGDVIWAKAERRRKTRIFDDVEMLESTPAEEPMALIEANVDEEFKEAVAQLDLELGVDELLKKNAVAMAKLVTLQNERYRMGSKAPAVKEGSEEWQLAHSINRSLQTIISLRPRKAGSAECPLLPPPSVLRALHRTLPVDPTPGWKGTLSKDNEVAYRDNSTITAGTTPYVNPTPAPAASTPAPTAKPVAAPAITHYPSYGPAFQRPGLPATTSSYYNNTPHPYYAQYTKPPGTPTGTPGAGYYYNYPQYATYAQYGYQAQGQPQSANRAIPNVAKPAPPYVNGWGTPAAPLPTPLRKTAPPGTPTYPPNFSGAYPGFPGYPMQKA